MSATAAGSEIVCECGRSISVPSLSDLRLAAGKEAYVQSTVARIAHMVRDGELPAGNICGVSGQFTEDIMIFCVECERIRVRHRGFTPTVRTIIGFLLLGWIGGVLGWIKKVKPSREIGRQVVVHAPMRICCEYHSRLKRRSQRYLKRLLSRIPIYAALLKEYPEATVHVVKSMPRTLAFS